MLAFVLHGLIGDWTRYEMEREARILDPYDCVSADGSSTFRCEPSEREGRGPSTVYLLKDGTLAWIEDLPFTLREAVVARDGAILGRAGDGHLWIRGAGESAFRELAPPYASTPTSMVESLLDISWENGAIVRVRHPFADESGQGRMERWWRFDFVRGGWDTVVAPEGGSGRGFGLLFADEVAHALVATEFNRGTGAWARALDARGCTLGRHVLAGTEFNPYELVRNPLLEYGIILRQERDRLSMLDRDCGWGLDLRPRLFPLPEAWREPNCSWEHLRLVSLGTSADALPEDTAVEAPRSVLRRLDGGWLKEATACTRLPERGFALVDFPMRRRGERYARLLLTDASGQPADEFVLPFDHVSQITIRGDWVVVVPGGRASVALVNRRTRERFEVLTHTYGRNARASLSADTRELAVLDVERSSLERFAFAPR